MCTQQGLPAPEASFSETVVEEEEDAAKKAASAEGELTSKTGETISVVAAGAEVLAPTPPVLAPCITTNAQWTCPVCKMSFTASSKKLMREVQKGHYKGGMKSNEERHDVKLKAAILLGQVLSQCAEEVQAVAERDRLLLELETRTRSCMSRRSRRAAAAVLERGQ